MSDIVIKVENLSKQYRLGTVGTGTISHDLNRWWAQVRGKEDPFLKIGETNDRTQEGSSDYVWSLKDISFEVRQGEVLGIIGKNGAGKSTLLKILSKVTGPTTGRIMAKGRIGALLEVGTGFHPELTGRENIFLNGAILGMTKPEIKAKLDEIIDFSGCARYVDTPVKRYSSGMKVRLAFAVAAFLEPEILIVDEVLAVGDAEFQKKAIGKMQDVSRGEGRTVLFVSHNMDAVKDLCTRCAVLNNGEIDFSGSTFEAVDYYLNSISTSTRLSFFNSEVKENSLSILSSQIKAINSDDIKLYFDAYDRLQLIINYRVPSNMISGCALNFIVYKDEIPLFHSWEFSDESELEKLREVGDYQTIIEFPVPFFKPGSYSISLSVAIPFVKDLEFFEKCLQFKVELLSKPDRLVGFAKRRPGIIAFDQKWNSRKVG